MNLPIIGAQGCGNCKHSKVENGSRCCFRRPPTSTPITVMTAKGPQVVGHVTMFAKVEDSMKCGDYEARLVETVEAKVKVQPK